MKRNKRWVPYDISPKYVAFIFATALTVAGILLLLLLSWLIPPFLSVWVLFLSAIALFFITYFLSVFCIEMFIYSKIKLIYKTIHSLKTKNFESLDFNLSKDFLKQVNKEVIDWSNTKKNEIKELKEKESFRREFIGNLSHELKTPIFSIQGYLLTLLEGGLEDERINRNFLERAGKGVERMITLVEDLESIAQLESGNLKLEMEKFDLAERTRDIMETLEMRAEKRKVKLKFNKTYDKAVKVIADPNRIAQVLSNLIVNAINYSKKSGAEVEIRFFDMDEHILVEVADNGIGIDAENLPRIFERFFREDKSRSRHIGGSGLGLSICKHIMDAHNETLNVRSTKDLGSTFSFTLRKA